MLTVRGLPFAGVAPPGDGPSAAPPPELESKPPMLTDSERLPGEAWATPGSAGSWTHEEGSATDSAGGGRKLGTKARASVSVAMVGLHGCLLWIG